MREQFDEIYISFINGQHTQAVKQARKLDGYGTAVLLAYIATDLNQPDVAIDFAQTYFRLMDIL